MPECNPLAVTLGMRILFLTSALRKEFGGPPIVVVGASTSLADLENEITVMVFGQTSSSVLENEGFYSKLEEHNVRTIVAHSRRTSIYGGIGNLSDFGKLYAEIKKADIISTHAVYNFQNILIFILLLVLNKPYVLMPHGTLTKYQSKIHRFRKLFVDLYFRNILIWHADAVIVATEVEKSELSTKLQKKTHVIGVGLQPIDSSSNSLRVKSDASKFLFLGRIAPVKRLDIAILAFAHFVQQAGNDYKLIVCGTGDPKYVNSMERLACELGVTKQVEFRGWVDSIEKAQVLRECSWLLMTSENENFAVTVAESLKHGIPCIVSKNVALSALVIEHSAGEVFQNLDPVEISEAMRRVATGNQSEMQKAALSAAQDLSWDRVVLNWSEVFANILRQKS